VNCLICASETRLFDTAIVLGKYAASYYRCDSCGFIQVANPHWLSESYSSGIAGTDLGLADRNYADALITKACIAGYFSHSSSYIDYGGGYGLFVRLMRDRGYDFYLWDKYCQNIFAAGFEADIKKRYDLLTAFEVFEHLPDPVHEIERMLDLSSNLFFSTLLVPDPAPKVKDWWYYGPHHGQHITFYTVKSLEALARKWKLNLVTNGSTFHLLTPSTVSNFLFKLTCRRKVSALIDLSVRRKSLRDADVEYLMKRAAASKKPTIGET
jgi:hypothetical protein